MFVKNSKTWLFHVNVLQTAANRDEQNFITHVQKYCFVYANFAEVFVAVPSWFPCSIFELGGITMYKYVCLVNIEVEGGALFASLFSFLYGRVRRC